MEKVKSYNELQEEVDELRRQLGEATQTIEAIRNGEIDALVVEGKNGHELYTLNSADRTYRTFIEQMSEGAVTLNPHGIVVYCNSRFANMIGEPVANIIPHPLADFIHPSDVSTFQRMIEEAWQTELKGEVRLKKSDHPIPVQLSITPIDLDSGRTLSIIATDLTTQKETLNSLRINNQQLEMMNIQLEQSNSDLQQFASVASHDLQEPLRKIQVFAHLLYEKYGHELSAVSKGYIEKIVRASNRMKVLIVDILNYSRLSSKDQHYAMTDVRAMIDELLLDLELVIKEKDAVIHVDHFPEMEINPGQMRQVFQNLLSNALKFSRSNVPPVIEIFYREAEPGGHQIHVKDNGIGFDEKFSKSIFNLFEKLHSKDDYDGSGIGLAIAKKIIEKHHGEIVVRSQPGIGTEFIITLPKGMVR